ncbi:hypothetical protein JST97_15825 [bacterium]|nr:hypothetical protein [bacterium]
MEESLVALEGCLEGLPDTAPEAARLVRLVLPQLERWSYVEQIGQFLLNTLKSNPAGCKAELQGWVAEVRHPGLHRSYALPGAPPPPPPS